MAKPKHTIIKEYKGNRNAIYGCINSGPRFGNGHDLYISNNCHSNNNSYTNLGHTYYLPNNISSKTNEFRSYLAGSCRNFQVEEYEVFFIN